MSTKLWSDVPTNGLLSCPASLLFCEQSKTSKRGTSDPPGRPASRNKRTNPPTHPRPVGGKNFSEATIRVQDARARLPSVKFGYTRTDCKRTTFNIIFERKNWIKKTYVRKFGTEPLNRIFNNHFTPKTLLLLNWNTEVGPMVTLYFLSKSFLFSEWCTFPKRINWCAEAWSINPICSCMSLKPESVI